MHLNCADSDEFIGRPTQETRIFNVTTAVRNALYDVLDLQQALNRPQRTEPRRKTASTRYQPRKERCSHGLPTPSYIAQTLKKRSARPHYHPPAVGTISARAPRHPIVVPAATSRTRSANPASSADREASKLRREDTRTRAHTPRAYQPHPSRKNLTLARHFIAHFDRRPSRLTLVPALRREWCCPFPS